MNLNLFVKEKNTSGFSAKLWVCIWHGHVLSKLFARSVSFGTVHPKSAQSFATLIPLFHHNLVIECPILTCSKAFKIWQTVSKSLARSIQLLNKPLFVSIVQEKCIKKECELSTESWIRIPDTDLQSITLQMEICRFMLQLILLGRTESSGTTPSCVIQPLNQIKFRMAYFLTD